MNRQCLFFTCGSVLCFVLLGCSSPADNPAPDRGNAIEEGQERLAVKILPECTRLHNKESFYVALRITNPTRKLQTFDAMSCKWPNQWQISNPRLSKSLMDCYKNVRETIDLQPGEAYEKTMLLNVNDGPQVASLTFRMGFTPLDEKTTYWSNKVILSIKPH